ncbi:MAG: AraC family transcriptional regulator [Tannerella sp.]|jgi:AraC-like DNA-binding protein|nr:AraC family transcriptional regulator [Tannerella sp.]
MKIYNVEEHVACYCYDNGDDALIEVRKNKQIFTGEFTLKYNDLVFVLEGKIRLIKSNNVATEICKGDFVLIPANHQMRYKIFSGGVYVIIRLQGELSLCQSFNLDRLNSKIKLIQEPAGYSVLPINARLKHLTKGIVEAWDDGLKCRYYFQAKISELLIMLRAYYSEDDLCHFFYYYFTSDIGFMEFVRSYHLQYNTVNELSTALNMTPQQFSRRFQRVFGETPYGWMQREKARLIYGDICRTNKPLKDIANEYGFNIQANFNRFCKMAFGKNPGEIRKTRA